ncbi:SDR family NAD(P)-dependent oxidoreductase [Spirillospora sp. NPDC048911]|uniref:SDR family NAD(P)-dependent oxidoreductase n=1 Tax=Spirillospora sp. NPDC048911 TaxID=3364527 RepID=UPI003710EC8F
MRENEMLLANKNAIIYGAGGFIGGAVAANFAREGARVFLAGRTRDKLAAIADEITGAGGRAEVAVVDVMDEQAVDEHTQSVVDAAGAIDVSFNLATRGDVQGIPLIDMTTADFTRPVVTGLTANFITARAAARHMVKRGSGVVLALDSGSAGGSPMMGGTGPADGALDSFIRNLAAETGPRGVRAVGIWTAGLPETLSPERIAEFSGTPQMDDAAFEGLIKNLDQMRMTNRSPRLAEVAATATFLASDHAAAITGTWVNTSSGMFPG